MNDLITAKLKRNYDSSLLLKDLNQATTNFKSKSQFGPYHDGSWTGIPLRNFDGDKANPIAASQGIGKNTEVLDHCPYFKEIIDSFPASIQTARLLFLPPNKKIGHHRDYFKWSDGSIRLHIPIVTHKDVEFNLADQQHHWPSGELWFGDFNYYHSFHNKSDITRVHLVIDCLLTNNLLNLFEEEDRNSILKKPDIKIHRDCIKLTNSDLEAFTGYFKLPKEISALPFLAESQAENGQIIFQVSGLPINYRFIPLSKTELACLGTNLTLSNTPGLLKLSNPNTNLDCTIQLSKQLPVAIKALLPLQKIAGKTLFGLIDRLFKLSQLKNKAFGTKT